MEAKSGTDGSGKSPFSRLEWPTPGVLRKAHRARAEFLRQLIVAGWSATQRFLSTQIGRRHRKIAEPRAVASR